MSFFFGLLFVTEVMLILVFGVDYRYVEAAYIGPSWRLGVMDFPLRMLVPCLAALALFVALELYLSYTFIGRAIAAVAQDQLALRLMGASPVRIKRIAFGISIATALMARPVNVPDRKPCSAMSNVSEARHGTSMRSGRSIMPQCRLGPI